MQINGEYLLPQMSLKNTGTAGANVLSDEESFQAQLQAATDKLNKTSSTKIKTMTDDEVAKRNQEIKDASVQLEAIMLKLMYNEMWKTVINFSATITQWKFIAICTTKNLRKLRLKAAA